jgi:pantothenate kinase type III
MALDAELPETTGTDAACAICAINRSTNEMVIKDMGSSFTFFKKITFPLFTLCQFLYR